MQRCQGSDKDLLFPFEVGPVQIFEDISKLVY